MLFASVFLQRRAAQRSARDRSPTATPTAEELAADPGLSAHAEGSVAAASVQADGPETPQASAGTRGSPTTRQTIQPRRVQLPLRVRLQHMGGSVERFLIRHRTSSALIFAYCSFFWRLYDESGKLSSMAPAPLEMELTSGPRLLDPEFDVPLTRASVLSRVKLAGPGSKKPKGTGLRREKGGKISSQMEEELDADEDPVTVLEGALRLAAAEKEPIRRAQLLSESYAALGHIHSARGHYYAMLHAMNLALRSSADSGDSETVCKLQIALGHLEFKHHRYYAAGTRFEDALQTGATANQCNVTRAEARAGLAWAELEQGSDDAAGRHFLEALSWSSNATQLSATAAASFAAAKATSVGCCASHDGLDAMRTLSYAGLSLASTRQSAAVAAAAKPAAERPPALLLQCAVSIYQGLSPAVQEPHVWTALGLARHALHETAAAKRYHQRSALRERRDPSLAPVQQSAHEPTTCAIAADLPSCSHNALHLGLVDFEAGNASLGVGHVEVLLSRTGAVSVEVAEWLTRFARAHAWVPSGRDFASFLLGRVEPLLKSEGDARMARHFADYGRFLLSNRDKPARLKRALTQLNRARDIIERVDVGWGYTEVAALYSTMGAVQHQVGEIQEAVVSFEKALEFDRQAAAAGRRPDHKRMLLSHANLGATRLQLAGSDARRWRIALNDLKDGRRVAREAGLSILDPTMQKFEASFRNAMRLAHRRGMLETCPGPLDALLYGPSCPIDAEMA